MKQVPGHGGPEFGKGVAAHSSGKTQGGAQAGVAHAGFAVRPPGIREEIVAGNADVSGVGGGQVSVSPARDEGHYHHVLDPAFERLAGGGEISGSSPHREPIVASMGLPVAMPVKRIP